MVHTNREDVNERDTLIHESNATGRDETFVQEQARGKVVVVASAIEMVAGEKDREESEIAVATFTELVSITSAAALAQCLAKRLWHFV